MKHALMALALLTSVTMVSGCATVYSPALGAFYTEVYGPVDTEGSLGSKEGKACAESILGLIATGDASIAAAAKAGGITKITNVDHYSRHRLVIGEFCTIVRGN